MKALKSFWILLLFSLISAGAVAQEPVKTQTKKAVVKKTPASTGTKKYLKDDSSKGPAKTSMKAEQIIPKK